ncbi:MAG: ABC transporter ATP-binding protein [Candidatus Sungbacteria bacterium]|uniref:ABC transporter ATP-binding protein n=1 Tax=Candidatus Sungiibacteriota bacterium TaxID=2750080 RepID=A0A933DRM5_9BACT|nr:ABC transporter ATP-binding protein [Candidatus Sungbacteria bacterium]
MPKKAQKTNIWRGWSIILKYLKPYRAPLTLIGVFSLVDAGANALTPLLAGRIFDGLVTPYSLSVPFAGAFPAALVFIATWFVIRALGDVAGWQKSVRQERFGGDIHADYLVAAFSRVLELPLSFHKSFRVGEVISRIQRGSDRLEQIANRVLIDLLPDFLSIIIAFAIIFPIQPRLAIVVAAAMGLYFILLLRTAPGLSVISYKMNRAYSNAFGYSSDILLNTQSVKQATAESYERRQLFRFFNLRAARLWSDYMKIWQGLSFYQRAIITVMQLGIFAYSYYLVRAGALTPGELVAFNGYAAIVFRPLAIIANNWDVVQNGLAAIDRAEKIIERAPELYTPENASILKSIRGDVEFRSVSFAYGKNRRMVLQDVAFNAKAGQSVALVGESGVGKSTLVDLVSGFYRPSKGKILIDGHDVSRLDLKFLRSQIAVVPQELLLFNDTVKANIRYGSFGASDPAIMTAAKRAHADDFIQKFPKKYNQLVGERGIKLSVGQKQRLAIARAILRDPRILILDEPTSALDARSEAVIQESLRELMQGRTTFIIAHRLSTVRRADAILVLDKGRIVERGRHEELIKIPNGVYRKLYELQIGLK